MSEHAKVLRELVHLLSGFEPGFRLIGNVKAGDVSAAVDETLAEVARLRADLAAAREREGDARRLADYIASLYEHNEIQDDDIYRLAVNFDKPATPEPAPAQPTCGQCNGTQFDRTIDDTCQSCRGAR